jgi:hypothetical protein
MEADLAEERAKRLRKKAADLIEQYGLAEEDDDRNGDYEATATNDSNHDDAVVDELAPLDENGNPKYKGKKRGRKPKPRKRKMNPNREKRKHTGYTLFMHENHNAVKIANSGLQNKEIISIVARRWKDLDDDEKLQWKDRATQAPFDIETGQTVGGGNEVTKTTDNGTRSQRLGIKSDDGEDLREKASNSHNNTDDDDDDDDDEDGDNGDSDEDTGTDSPVPPARKRSRRQRTYA